VGLPLRLVQPLQLGFLLLGFMGSLALLRHFASQDSQHRTMRAFLPWATVCMLLFTAGWWLMTQPMDMRATFLE
jgi:hypothetical protein